MDDEKELLELEKIELEIELLKSEIAEKSKKGDIVKAIQRWTLPVSSIIGLLILIFSDLRLTINSYFEELEERERIESVRHEVQYSKDLYDLSVDLAAGNDVPYQREMAATLISTQGKDAIPSLMYVLENERYDSNAPTTVYLQALKKIRERESPQDTIVIKEILKATINLFEREKTKIEEAQLLIDFNRNAFLNHFQVYSLMLNIFNEIEKNKVETELITIKDYINGINENEEVIYFFNFNINKLLGHE